MARLHQLQACFIEAITYPSEAQTLSKTIIPSDTLSAMGRIKIYQDSINAAKLNNLSSTYPVCQKLVGDHFFWGCARLYIKQSKHSDPNFNLFGGDFAEFLSGFKPVEQVPYLPDVARLEWAYQQATNAPTYTPCHKNAFINLNEAENMLLQLPPNSTLLDSPYPILKIWEVNQEEAPKTEIHLDQGGVKCLVWQKGYDINIDVLSGGQYQFLSCLQQPISLFELGEILSHQLPDYETQFPQLFAHYLHTQLLVCV